MLYKEKSSVSTSSVKICVGQSIRRSQPNTNAFLAKQPGNNYKIRLANDERRIRRERLRINNEDYAKCSIRNAVHKELIDVADTKYLFNHIKQMVDYEMKANENSFIEECPKLELKLEEKPKNLKISEEDIIEKAKMLKDKIDEEKRQLVEAKRLQLFIENSDELRLIAIAKRKKEIGDINYKVIQEKERAIKEQKFKKRELANYNNLEIMKKYNLEKEEEKRKYLEKQQQFRNDLYEQVKQKELNRKHEKELKEIDCIEFKKLNDELEEEEKNKKLEKIERQIRRQEEIRQFTEEKMKFSSKVNGLTTNVDKEFANLMPQNLKDYTSEKIESKRQLRRENDLFIKYHELIKEERKKQNDEITKTVLKQMNEIENIKKSIEWENVEARRRRKEERNLTMKEQLKSRELLLEKQKDSKREMDKHLLKEYHENLKKEKQLQEERTKYKLQLRKELKDQIKFREYIIEEQRKNDLENHQKLNLELEERENLLKKLSNAI